MSVRNLADLYLVGHQPRRQTQRRRRQARLTGEALRAVPWLAAARPYFPGPITRRHRA